MYILEENEQKWVNEIWGKIEEKMQETVKRNSGKIPYFAKGGKFDDKFSEFPCWWTNGFWPGIMWLLYQETRDELYMEEAQKCEDMLDKAFEEYYGLQHDVGFMWNLSAGAQYKITGSEKSKKRCLYAANLLAGRFNVNGDFIQAWDVKEHGYTSIIDCMMNLPLLYWASDELGDDRFRYMAQKHADSTIKNHIRSDGSVNHIVKYDGLTGEVADILGGQGYAKGSAWSRGQAWALYGFILSYMHTGKREYMDTAKRCANYFIASVCDDWLPKADFRAPQTPIVYDSSAGACAASGLLEIAYCLGEAEGRLYFDAAKKLLMTMEEHFCNWDKDYDSILQYASEAYSGTSNISLIYGDYFFIEAISKLKSKKILFW